MPMGLRLEEAGIIREVVSVDNEPGVAPSQYKWTTRRRIGDAIGTNALQFDLYIVTATEPVDY